MPRRRTIIILVLIAIAILVIIGAVCFKLREARQLFLSNQAQETDQRSLLESITAPEGTSAPISAAVEKSITAPAGKGISDNLLKDILESLTAPEK